MSVCLTLKDKVLEEWVLNVQSYTLIIQNEWFNILVLDLNFFKHGAY